MINKYREYYSLSLKELNSLPITNWFRQKHDIPIIEVPEEDINYYKQFAKILKETNEKT